MNWLESFIYLLFRALELAILIRIIISWIQPNPSNPLVQIIYQITDPILVPLRRIIPPLGFIDITPMVAIVVLQILQTILIRAIHSL